MKETTRILERKAKAVGRRRKWEEEVVEGDGKEGRRKIAAGRGNGDEVSAGAVNEERSATDIALVYTMQGKKHQAEEDHRCSDCSDEDDMHDDGEAIRQANGKSVTLVELEKMCREQRRQDPIGWKKGRDNYTGFTGSTVSQHSSATEHQLTTSPSEP